jgi:AcrR family transcriptional regulator
MVQEKNEQRSEIRPATVSRHEKLQTALLGAAERAIATQGLGALRARALAEEVGCAVGAIYTIFPDLDGIILAVNSRTLIQIDTLLGQAGDLTDPVAHLVWLASSYLDYAAGHRLRWLALFQHVMTAGRSKPDWFTRQQDAAFSHVETPLAQLCPALSEPDRALLARSLFASVHGMVILGLDEKLVPMPLPVLRQQIATIVTATARGLTN